tara:strand:- start:245 stop:457 length:213 start_codon:yes stop_codon:yes gene_type:complete
MDKVPTNVLHVVKSMDKVPTNVLHVIKIMDNVPTNVFRCKKNATLFLRARSSKDYNHYLFLRVDVEVFNL